MDVAAGQQSSANAISPATGTSSVWPRSYARAAVHRASQLSLRCTVSDSRAAPGIRLP